VREGASYLLERDVSDEHPVAVLVLVGGHVLGGRGGVDEPAHPAGAADGEVAGGEHAVERAEQGRVPFVRREVHLAQVRRAVHGHLHELAPGGALLSQRVAPVVRAHRRPPHSSRPANTSREATGQ
jgi:hypothetical protein